jgi:hypothetical protein
LHLLSLFYSSLIGCFLTEQKKTVPFLPVKDEFHPKRNQARQKLATLPDGRFKDLASDVFAELERRYPSVADLASASMPPAPAVAPPMPAAAPATLSIPPPLAPPPTGPPPSIPPPLSQHVVEEVKVFFLFCCCYDSENSQGKAIDH